MKMMPNEKLSIRCRSKDLSRFISFGIFIENKDAKKITACEKIDFKPIDFDYCVPDCITVDTKCAQVLMDDLWHCGIRPTECKSTGEVVQAKNEHIKDLRHIIDYTLIPRKVNNQCDCEKKADITEMLSDMP